MKQAKYFVCLAMLIYVQGYTQISILKTNGNIGLGTINPEQNLHFKGNTMQFENNFGLDIITTVPLGNYSNLIRIGGDNTARMRVRHVDGKSHLNGNVDDLYLQWKTGKNVIIGHSDMSSNLYNYGSLHVEGVLNSSQQIIIEAKSNRAGFKLKANSPDYAVFTLRNDWEDAVFSVWDESLGRWNAAFKYDYINRNLDVTGSISSYGNIIGSDRKLKKSIANYKRGIKSILQMNPIEYEYNGEMGSSKGEPHVGILAQDLMSIAPELVVTKRYRELDKTMTKTVRDEEYLAIKDNEIKWILVNAIKEQQAIIESQQSDIKSQRELLSEAFHRIDELEKKITIVDDDSVDVVAIELLENYDHPVLLQNVPNPTDQITTIHYYIPSSAVSASLEFISMSGQLIKSVAINGIGKGRLQVDISEIPSGNYKYSLIVDGKRIDSKTMGVIK